MTQKFETPYRLFGTLALSGLCALSLAACDGDDGPSQTPEEPPALSTSYQLQQATTCGQVRDRMVDTLTEQLLESRYNQWGGPGRFFGGEQGDNASAPQAAPNGGDEKAKPDDYTTTNIQEEGVDEADIIKTDGEHIYALNGSDVVILKSWPAKQTKELGRFNLGGKDQHVNASGMFLHGSKLAIFSSVWDQVDYRTNEDAWKNAFGGTRITILDISDKSAPKLSQQLDVEGYYNTARMIDGEVYLVSNGGLRLPFELWDVVQDPNSGLQPMPQRQGQFTEAEVNAMRAQNRGAARRLIRAKLAGHSVESLMPRSRFQDFATQEVTEKPLYACSDLYIPAQISLGQGVLNLTHFDLGNSPKISSTGLLSDGWQVYASKGNLYVSMSSRNWGWWWGQSEDSTTHIHQFKLDTPSREPVYTASGKVDGWAKDQFSFSEYKDHLRVATTDNRWEWDEQTGERSVVGGGNHLSILHRQGKELKLKSSIRNLAPGEQVFAARMMGDKGYVVTFEQTDPLFTFDLSDPANPKLTGELKINGFSSYIHPMGPNHLLTIGQDADDQGVVNGMHLQIFDVSDLKNPTRVQQYKLSTGRWSSWSEAMWNHHSFTYHPQKQLLAIPANIYDWENDAQSERFSGLILFKADAATGIHEVGRVSHADLTEQLWCPQQAIADEDGVVDGGEPGSVGDGPVQDHCTDYYDRYWWTNMRRSIFIEDYLYSISDVGLKVNDLLDPKTEHVSLLLRKDLDFGYGYFGRW